MPWLQISCEAQRDGAHAVEDALLGAGALSVTLTDAGEEPVLEPAPGETPLWPRLRVTALYDVETDPLTILALLSALPGGGPRPDTVVVERLEDRAWEREWLSRFRPMRFGERLWICPGGQAPPDNDAVTVQLDPGLAFGTGTHPTTGLCLEWLDAQLRPGATVLDYGCGSGILAIAALKLGARRAWAVDIEPQALEATAANSTLNVVSDDLWIGSPDRLPEIEADVILANILARPLIELAPRFAAVLSNAGTAVLSGVLVEQREEIREAYAAHFLELDERVLDGWVCLVAKHRRY